MSGILQKSVKWCLYSIFGVVAVLLAALAFVLFAVDPNWLKPEIEKQLAKQGIILTIENDISWQFYPNFGLQVEALGLKDEQGSKTIFRTGKAGFSLAIAPLFQRKIEVVAVNLVDTEVFYIIQEDGSTNWDFLTNNKPDSVDKEETKQASDDNEVALSVNKITIENANVFVDDRQSKTESTISNIAVDIRNVNLSGEQSEIALSGQAKVLQFPEVEFQLASLVQLADGNNALFLKNTQFTLGENHHPMLRLAMESDISFEKSKIEAKLSVTSDNLRSLVNLFEVSLPEEVPEKAFQSVAIKSNISVGFGDELNFVADALSIAVDDTVVEGKVSVVNSSEKSLPKVNLKLQSPVLNVSKLYKAKDKVGDVDEKPLAESEAAELPVELLKELSADVSISLGKLIYEKIELRDLKLNLSSHGGNLKLEQFEAKMEEGKITAAGQLDARKKVPELNSKVQTTNLNIGYLLENFADVKLLKGNLDGVLTLQSHGLDASQIQKNMDAKLDANSTELRLVPIDLIKNVCEAVAFVERKPLQERNWKSYTDLSPVNINAKVLGEKIAVDKLSAKVEKFNALASGRFDLSTMSFDFPIELSLADFAAELEGCNFISDEWRKKSFPLRCKGDVNSIDAKTCQPNYALIREKWKNKLEEKVDAEKERAKDRVEQEVKDKLKDKIGDKVDEQELERLKDIFKRK